jgi:hypothetical protein
MVAKLDVLSWHLPGGTDENLEISSLGYPISEPRFGPETYQIRSKGC